MTTKFHEIQLLLHYYFHLKLKLTKYSKVALSLGCKINRFTPRLFLQRLIGCTAFESLSDPSNNNNIENFIVLFL